MEKLTFEEELRQLINRKSMENGSNTPDGILCQYLLDCLNAFDKAVVSREKWYGRTIDQSWDEIFTRLDTKTNNDDKATASLNR